MFYPVREAQREEISVLCRLLMDMALESENVTLDAKTICAGVTHVFNHPECGQYWVVTEQDTDKIVGMCLITTEWSDWHNHVYWWFQSVYVLMAYRGQGVVEALMQHIEREAHAHGIPALRLYVATENERAIRVYEKQGYQADSYRMMQKMLLK